MLCYPSCISMFVEVCVLLQCSACVAGLRNPIVQGNVVLDRWKGVSVIQQYVRQYFIVDCTCATCFIFRKSHQHKRNFSVSHFYLNEYINYQHVKL
jgi:hypothetical protein